MHESAREKFNAGAHLLQLYTGFVYRGPSLLREIMDGIVGHARRMAFATGSTTGAVAPTVHRIFK